LSNTLLDEGVIIFEVIIEMLMPYVLMLDIRVVLMRVDILLVLGDAFLEANIAVPEKLLPIH
jgi:hypothetical protein